MSSSDPLLLVLLTTGITVGFGHCIGMCGPIVVSLSMNLRGKSAFIPQALYNGGRVITYAVLGGLMGVTGSFTGVISNIANIQKGVMIFAGIIIILMGFAMSGIISPGKIFADYHNPDGIISRGFKRFSNAESPIAYLPLGMLLGLLPCGPVYTALIVSVRAGMEASNPSQAFIMGAGFMLAFGIGTIPSLLIVAKLADLGWLKSKDLFYKISSVFLIIVGIYFVIRGIRY